VKTDPKYAGIVPEFCLHERRQKVARTRYVDASGIVYERRLCAPCFHALLDAEAQADEPRWDFDRTTMTFTASA